MLKSVMRENENGLIQSNKLANKSPSKGITAFLTGIVY